MKKKSGYLIWITGFSGSGKTRISKKYINILNKNLVRRS